MMTRITLATALLFPLLSFGAGWDYYVLDDSGNWTEVSPQELDLSTPGRSESGSTRSGEQRRIMILYRESKPQPREKQNTNWIRQVGKELVEQVE